MGRLGVVRAGRAAVGAERSPSARIHHAVVEHGDRGLDERVPGRRYACAPARRRCAPARASSSVRRAWRPDDDHRRSQDDCSTPASIPRGRRADRGARRRRAAAPATTIEARRVCVRVATGSQAVDVSRTRRRQGSVAGLGDLQASRDTRRRRQTPPRICVAHAVARGCCRGRSWSARTAAVALFPLELAYAVCVGDCPTRVPTRVHRARSDMAPLVHLRLRRADDVARRGLPVEHRIDYVRCVSTRGSACGLRVSRFLSPSCASLTRMILCIITVIDL